MVVVIHRYIHSTLDLDETFQKVAGVNASHTYGNDDAMYAARA